MNDAQKSALLRFARAGVYTVVGAIVTYLLGSYVAILKELISNEVLLVAATTLIGAGLQAFDKYYRSVRV